VLGRRHVRLGHVGDINGEVIGFEISSPFELLDQYTLRNKTEVEVAHLYEHANWFNKMGFPWPYDGWLVKRK
jgi:hypothetical protein